MYTLTEIIKNFSIVSNEQSGHDKAVYYIPCNHTGVPVLTFACIPELYEPP